MALSTVRFMIRHVEPYEAKSGMAVQLIADLPDRTPVAHLQLITLDDEWDTVAGRIMQAVGPSPFLTGMASSLWSSAPAEAALIESAGARLGDVKELLAHSFDTVVVGQLRPHLTAANLSLQDALSGLRKLIAS